MVHTTLQKESNKATESDTADNHQFLAQARCVEIEDPVDPIGQGTYLLDTLPRQVPLYGPECVHFVNTDNT